MLTDGQQKAAERFRDAVTEYITAIYGDDVASRYFLEVQDDPGGCQITVTGLHGGGVVGYDIYERIECAEDEWHKAWQDHSAD